jgi:hypothetical protein
MQPAEPVEFSRPLALDRVSTTQHREEITATDKERAALAQRFDLISLDNLTASFALKRVRKDLVRVKGRALSRWIPSRRGSTSDSRSISWKAHSRR